MGTSIKPIVASFHAGMNFGEVSSHFGRRLSEFDPNVFHVFKGFYQFSPDEVDADVLPLSGEKIHFRLLKRELFHESKYSIDRTDFVALAQYVNPNIDILWLVTIGIYEYVGTKILYKSPGVYIRESS